MRIGIGRDRVGTVIYYDIIPIDIPPLHRSERSVIVSKSRLISFTILLMWFNANSRKVIGIDPEMGEFLF